MKPDAQDEGARLEGRTLAMQRNRRPDLIVDNRAMAGVTTNLVSPLEASAPADERVIRPGRNAWRLERASRAAVLVDAAAYFSAVRRAMRKARRSIYIVGWDINSRVRLVGESGEPDDGLPAALGDFLCALVRERPDLSIKLLLWDFSVVYSFEREPWPLVSLQWRTPPQIELCLDDALPTGSSHHQKIVVVDDEVAFCGGLDLTVRRWDRPDHSPGNPHRVDAAGVPYGPFHDVQLLVDGPAAKALANLARTRWARAAYERLRPVQAESDPWPETITPDFRDVSVAISRTEPAHLDGREVREVETLFSDMIDAAQRSIYIENQFLTCVKVAPLLAAALRGNPRLEVLIVAPKAHNSWIGERTMLAGRIRFIDCLRSDGLADRVRVVHPRVSRGGESADVMVHSKVMIVDDRLLRVGSANMTNRSMGTDTECDLTIEADGHSDRAGIVAVRNRLMAEHCGASPAEVQAVVNRTGSLLATIDALDGRDHRLIEIARGPVGAEEMLAPIEIVADPERPIDITSFINGFGHTTPSRRRLQGVARLGVAVAAIVLVILAWRYTQLSELTRPGTLQAFLARVGDNPWTPLVVVIIFVLAGLVGFPVTALIAGTAVTFGAWPGLAYAAAGALASAVVTYLIGSWAGTDLLRRLIGPRLSRIRRLVAKRGILAVMSIRLVPIAPFTLVNLVAGALRIPPLDYVIGTALGLAPGLIVMSLLGDQIFQVFSDPSLSDVAIFVGLLAAWIGLSIGLQVLLARARGRRP
jgi:phospholipase D1/2